MKSTNCHTAFVRIPTLLCISSPLMALFGFCCLFSTPASTALNTTASLIRPYRLDTRLQTAALRHINIVYRFKIHIINYFNVLHRGPPSVLY